MTHDGNSALKALLTQVNETYSSNLQSTSGNSVRNNKGHIPRPMNAFMLWARHERKLLQVQRPDLRNIELSKILGDMWRKMSSTDKRTYLEKAEEIKIQHKIDYPNYKYKPKRRKSSKRDALLNASNFPDIEKNTETDSLQYTSHQSKLPLVKRSTSSMTTINECHIDNSFLRDRSYFKCMQCHKTQPMSFTTGWPSYENSFDRHRTSLLTTSLSTPCVATGPYAQSATRYHAPPSLSGPQEPFYAMDSISRSSGTTTSLQSPMSLSQEVDVNFDFDLGNEVFSETPSSLTSNVAGYNPFWSIGQSSASRTVEQHGTYEVTSSHVPINGSFDDLFALNDIVPSIGFE